MAVVVLVELGFLGVQEVRVDPTYLDHLVDLDVPVVLEDLAGHLFLLGQLVHLLDLVVLLVLVDLVDQEGLWDRLVLGDLAYPLDRQHLEVRVVVVEELVVVGVEVEEGVVQGDNMYVNMLEHRCLDILRHTGWPLVCVL
jgi:hypothetical protein